MPNLWYVFTSPLIMSCYTSLLYCSLTIIIDKATWVGCGQHIPMVMDSISESDWCTCSPKTVVDGKEYPPKMGQGKRSEAAKVGIGYED